MKPRLQLAMRDWDYLTPLLVGDLHSPDFDLVLKRVDRLPGLALRSLPCDACELSFSQYVRTLDQGGCELVGIPNFVMRGFRQRCIVTRQDSQLDCLRELAGRRVALSGWANSGHTWTRTALLHHGIDLEDIDWVDCTDKAAPVDLLEQGLVDAALLPFMPPGFFSRGSALRPVQRACWQHEQDYLAAVGYVPGIHILGIRRELARLHPWLPQALSDLIDTARSMWRDKRQRYLDTSPWINEEWQRCRSALPAHWDASGVRDNVHMISDFAASLFQQGLTSRALLAAEIFPEHPLS
ncbi:ABC transporter substrate-binding protein [Herbaspirillum frisingense]|uniref:ABC transporter substrate-binding protein n=1 Tax=Herbaspirillum frisingense TaxID=92645 RepID=UPI001F1E43F0|nr:ABC transporter substrate-binding protein [Herbaspirillum frisingense]UIN19389.1 ABC transporter substrate-binding protein [Herbaspirillum frisingense]